MADPSDLDVEVSGVSGRRARDRALPFPLLERGRELTRVGGLLAGASRGQGGALVIRGEAGAGKSALLSAALRDAGPMTVVRLDGILAEAEVPYAGLERILCAARVPSPTADRDALVPSAPDPSAWMSYVAVARGLREVLVRLVEATGPTVLAVDDAQWLDPETTGMLGSLGRRLGDLPAALLIAVRDDAGHAELAGIDEVTLTGLNRDHVSELVGAVTGSPAVPEVVLAICRASGGNPLAVADMAAGLSAEQLAGRVPLPDPLPVGARLVDAFQPPLAELGERCRRALLLVVTTGGGAPVLHHALGRVDVRLSDLAPAEDASLVRLTPAGAEFRHPLARTAVFWGARAEERRRFLAVAAEASAQHGAGVPMAAGVEGAMADAGAARAPAPVPQDYSVQLLDGFAVQRGSVGVTPRQSQPAQAVKMVALRGRVPVEELVEALWPDAEPGIGRVRLRNVLARVRESCPGLLVRDRDMVRLGSGASVDVRQFEEEAASAVAAVDTGDPAAAERVTLALALYPGELLPGDRYAGWASTQRERLAHRHRELLEILVDEAEKAGDTAGGVRLVEHAIALQPYDEGLYVRAARLMARRGWRSKALEMLHKAEAIAGELGVPPSRTARDLRAQLRGA